MFVSFDDSREHGHIHITADAKQHSIQKGYPKHNPKTTPKETSCQEKRTATLYNSQYKEISFSLNIMVLRKRNPRRRRRKRRRQAGGNIFGAAADIGASLGRSRKYRRLSFSGASDRGANVFRRQPWLYR